MQSRRQPRLVDVVKPELVRVGVRAWDREDAIRKAGDLLVQNHIAEPRYVDAMVRTCDELGPYIVLAPGVAIPHAASEDGARAVGLALIALAEPIEFGNEENDPVHIVIAFASCDSDIHVGILSSLAHFLEDKKRIHAVAKASSSQEVIRQIVG